MFRGITQRIVLYRLDEIKILYFGCQHNLPNFILPTAIIPNLGKMELRKLSCNGIWLNNILPNSILHMTDTINSKV